MIKRCFHTCALLMSLSCFAGHAVGKESDLEAEAKFNHFVNEIKAEAVSKGYDKKLVKKAFANITFRKKIVKADRSQPEFIETLETYLPKRVPKWKVDKARKLFKQHQALLTEIGDKYRVQPRFIVALWGLETNFGKIQGSYPIIPSLVTLSYEGRRGAFFKKELWAALDILVNEGVPIDKFVGSWAGAMGQTQFMPSSFNAYAVDYDGDGKRDIWTNPADVFASMANYLKTRGWNDDLTWGRQVKLPDNFDFNLVVPKETKNRADWLDKWAKTERSLTQWNTLGIRRMDGKSLPNKDLSAAIMIPDGKKGRIYLAYDNYKVLMHWNRSYYFVTTVGYLADRIAFPKIK